MDDPNRTRDGAIPEPQDDLGAFAPTLPLHGQAMQHNQLDLSSEIGVGSRIAGKYLVDRELGRGGMGVVFAATHTGLNQRVAIKLLFSQTLQNPETLDRFQREARASVHLQSDHVARVIDVGMLDTGAPYMVMEYLEGCDLSQLVRSNGPLPVAVAIDYVLQACEAIGEAHSAGIVHRDLKPSNLFLTRTVKGEARVKVLDFGISKLRPSSAVPEDAASTKTSAVMGSPLYMSPEQMRSSKNVDHRADIWSLGVVLFELLTGRVPWQGSTILEVAAGVLTSPATRANEFRPDLPAALVSAVAKCLEKDPINRFSSVEELVLTLSPFRSGTTNSWNLVDAMAQTAQGVEVVRGGATNSAQVLTNAPVVVSKSKAWIGVLGAVVLTGTLGLVLIISDFRKQAKSEYKPEVSNSARGPIAAPSSLGVLAARCSPDAGDLESSPWCNPVGEQIAECARGLVPSGRSGICGCPPGGTLDPALQSSGCSAPVTTQEQSSLQVQEVVRSLAPQFRGCYNTSLPGNPNLRGKTTVTVDLAPDGRVFSASMKSSFLPNVEVQECVLNKLKAARFSPPVGGSARLAIPIVFELTKE